METNASCLFEVKKHGVEFTIDGGEYSAKNNPVRYIGINWAKDCSETLVNNSSTVNIHSGTFKVAKASIDSFTVQVQSGRLNISGGNFYSEYQSCVQSDFSITTISGGNFTSSKYVVSQTGGNLTINGGTFTGKAVETWGYVTLIGGTGTNLEINGGIFSVESTGDARAVLFYIGTEIPSKAKINGGIFAVKIGDGATANAVLMNLASGETGKILAGGTYNVNPGNYLADGYEAVDNSDGTWTVKAKTS